MTHRRSSDALISLTVAGDSWTWGRELAKRYVGQCCGRAGLVPSRVSAPCYCELCHNLEAQVFAAAVVHPFESCAGVEVRRTATPSEQVTLTPSNTAALS